MEGMRFRSALTIVQKCISKRSPCIPLSRCQCFSSESRPCLGIAFDIDGVVLRGHAPIAGASEASRRLYNDAGSLRIPFLFLTNGGGIQRVEESSGVKSTVSN